MAHLLGVQRGLPLAVKYHNSSPLLIIVLLAPDSASIHCGPFLLGPIHLFTYCILTGVSEVVLTVNAGGTSEADAFSIHCQSQLDL